MNGTTMVVAIVFISVGFSVLASMYKKHLAFKEKALNFKQNDQQNNVHNNTVQEQITQLEQRIQVLEKIVTDEGYTVQKEINNL